jgi:hypothetical protein
VQDCLLLQWTPLNAIGDNVINQIYLYKTERPTKSEPPQPQKVLTDGRWIDGPTK